MRLSVFFVFRLLFAHIQQCRAIFIGRTAHVCRACISTHTIDDEKNDHDTEKMSKPGGSLCAYASMCKRFTFGDYALCHIKKYTHTKKMSIKEMHRWNEWNQWNRQNVNALGCVLSGCVYTI